MFFGRLEELSILKDFYDSPGSGVACIYGRAGMGKTSLIRHFIKDLRHLFFSAYATTGNEETALLARVIDARKRVDPSIPCTEQLRALLGNIGEIAAESPEEPFVFVIDNYTSFARAEAGFDKALYDFIKSCPNIKLILCSDSFLQVQKLVLDKKSVWAKSLDVCLELKALGFYESAGFLGGVTDPYEKAFIYGMSGGIPAHLSRVGDTSVSSIEEMFFKNNGCGLLPEHTMQTELRELSYYNHILTALAAGHNRVNQISACVDKPKDVVVPYMSTLINIGVVTKENPVTEKTNRKKTRYSIINSFDHFWYRFFAPCMEMYFEGDTDRFIDRSVNPGKDEFMRTVFITMCKEYLQKRSAEGFLPFVISEIGNWWQNDDEKMTTQGFDIVAIGEMDDDEAMLFGRCYYNDEPVGIATLKELIDLTKQVKGKKNVFYLVFSKSGFHENTTTVAATIKNIILVSLEEIVNG